MELNCSIGNVNGASFPNLEFKKLRQVVFISENRKEIKIYSTMIIAGNKDEFDEDKPIISQLNKDFKLNVKFDVGKDSNIKIRTQENEEFIDDFYEEIDKIQPIWGSGCKKIDRQEDVEKQLKKMLNNERIDTNLTAIDEKKYFCIEDDGNQENEILAHPGEIISKTNDGYTIGLKKTLHKGIDCIVCVKTTLFLSQRMSPRVKLNMRLSLTRENNVMLSYISVYICPPEGYHLGNDARVKAEWYDIHSSNNADEFNNLSEVAPRENIYYKEWIKKEHIMSRTVYRLNREKLFKNQRVKNCKDIYIEFHMSPVTEKGSPQFVLGALFSATVTYGVDSGRLSSVSEGFVQYIPNDFQWLLFCFITFWAFIRWCSRKYNINSENDKVLNKISLGCLVSGIICGGLWTIVTFVVSRIKIDFIIHHLPYYWKIAPWMLGLSVISLFSYILISYTCMRKNYGRKPISRELFY